MADHLIDIFGTEKDKVNCPFYWKIGACRHGDRCSRIHNRPTFSQTLLVPKMYPNPRATPLVDANGQPIEYDEPFLAEHFEDFYEDVFEELSKYGELEELHVCDNLCQHLLGNVYAKFYREEDTQKALDGLRGRFYAGRSLAPELCPVTDFREARCRQYETNECQRGGYCNFLHLRDVPRSMLKSLFKDQLETYHDREHTSEQLDHYYDAYKSKVDKRRGGDEDRGRKRSLSPRGDRYSEGGHDRGRDYDRDHRDRHRDRDREYDRGRERERSPKRSRRSRSPERERYSRH